MELLRGVLGSLFRRSSPDEVWDEVVLRGDWEELEVLLGFYSLYAKKFDYQIAPDLSPFLPGGLPAGRADVRPLWNE